jgi:hypothetical protein
MHMYIWFRSGRALNAICQCAQSHPAYQSFGHLKSQRMLLLFEHNCSALLSAAHVLQLVPPPAQFQLFIIPGDKACLKQAEPSGELRYLAYWPRIQMRPIIKNWSVKRPIQSCLRTALSPLLQQEKDQAASRRHRGLTLSSALRSIPAAAEASPFATFSPALPFPAAGFAPLAPAELVGLPPLGVGGLAPTAGFAALMIVFFLQLVKSNLKGLPEYSCLTLRSCLFLPEKLYKV